MAAQMAVGTAASPWCIRIYNVHHGCRVYVVDATVPCLRMHDAYPYTMDATA